MSRTVLGHSVQRAEDGALLTGRARFVDDVALHDRRALGRLRAVDVAAHALLIGRRRRARHAPRPESSTCSPRADLDLPPARAMGGDGALDRPLLARERVRFVGEPIAVVVAATRAQAFDAAELVDDRARNRSPP